MNRETELRVYEQLKDGQYSDFRFQKDAAKASGYAHAPYVSTLARQGKVPSLLIEVNGRKRRLIDVPALIAYKEEAEASSGFGGTHDVRRYMLRINPNVIDIEAVRKLLADHLPEGEWSLRKPKTYGKRKSKSKAKDDFTINILEDLKKGLEVRVPSEHSSDDDDDDEDFLN